MNITNYTKEEINNAIYKVLITQYKQDAKEAHKIVKEVGYEVYKYDGSFGVRNPKSYRSVHIDFSKYSNRGTLLIGSKRKRFDSCVELKPVDFVGQLETTRTAWQDPYFDEESEALTKYHNIKHNEYMAKSYDDDIKKTLEEIADLQKKIIRYTEYKAEYKAKAENYRKEYGLKKGAY